VRLRFLFTPKFSAEEEHYYSRGERELRRGGLERPNLEGRRLAADDPAEHAALPLGFPPAPGGGGGARGGRDPRGLLRAHDDVPVAFAGGGGGLEVGAEHGEAPRRRHLCGRQGGDESVVYGQGSRAFTPLPLCISHLHLHLQSHRRLERSAPKRRQRGRPPRARGHGHRGRGRRHTLRRTGIPCATASPPEMD
jgi:hypothetical protein